MKRKLFYLLFVFVVLAAAAAASATADDAGTPVVSDEMIHIMQSNLYNIFVLRGAEINFNSKTTTQISDVGSNAALRSGDDGEMHQMQMFANADFIHDYLSLVTVNTGTLKNFLLSMDITVQEVYPADQGGCFIGYTNNTGSPTANEEPLVTKAILVNGANQIGFYTREEGSDAGTFEVLAQLNQKYNKIILVRFMGQSYIFVNEEYVGSWDAAAKGEYDHTEDRLIGQFNDGIQGPFKFLYGTAVFSGGDTASCSFDNFILRKVTN